MMNILSLKYVYFVGIGGIGMSAIARYFVLMGKKVFGYDRTPSSITRQLEQEGAVINYTDDVKNIPAQLLDANRQTEVLVVYTPAIPAFHSELSFFMNNNFVVMKRAQVLGLISQNANCVAISGTHGKTSTTTMTTHILKNSHIDCSAFLGGISKNYNTNFLYSDKSNVVVVEADEFDRSFHQLSPIVAVVTAMDADHLDIYGTHQAVIDSFYTFIGKIRKCGTLIYKLGLPMQPIAKVIEQNNLIAYTYSQNNSLADFYAKNIKIENAEFCFDIVTPQGEISDIHYKVPGMINIENAVAAVAASLAQGASFDEVRNALSTFQGVCRRFDYHLKTDQLVYLDDYAHHPEELKASISSIKMMFPDKKITGIFQSHLYTRTRDFADDFAKSLSLLDEVFLLDIYPARELPIEGVDANLIFNKITISQKHLCKKENLLEILQNHSLEVLMTIGAGDIDQFIEPITNLLKKRLN